MAVLDLVAAERRRLADALGALDPADWDAPSLCTAWSNHQVAAHLNVPFEIGLPQFAVGLLKARGRFDRANERFAVDLAGRLDPEACVAGLRRHAEHSFSPPGFGHEAPLTDTIVHGFDILQPLGRSVAPDPEALRVVLAFLTSAKAGKFGGRLPKTVVAAPTDLDDRFGDGAAELRGPALSIIAAGLGRTPARADLDGPGVALLPGG